MVFFNKKRIEIIVSCVIIALFVFSIQISNKNNIKEKDSDNNKILETTATPASGKNVVIDAGHGVPDERIL